MSVWASPSANLPSHLFCSKDRVWIFLFSSTTTNPREVTGRNLRQDWSRFLCLRSWGPCFPGPTLFYSSNPLKTSSSRIHPAVPSLVGFSVQLAARVILLNFVFAGATRGKSYPLLDLSKLGDTTESVRANLQITLRCVSSAAPFYVVLSGRLSPDHSMIPFLWSWNYRP